MMKTSAIAVAIMLASLLATPASAAPTNIFENPGFETGTFDPWYVASSGGDDKGGPRDEGDWFISDGDAHSGQYCAAAVAGTVNYDFATPVSVDEISSISFWLKKPAGGLFHVSFEYAFGPATDIMIPSDGGQDWRLIEIGADELGGMSDVVRFSFTTCPPLGGAETRCDDFSLVVVPEPGTLALLAMLLPIVAHRRRQAA